MFAFCLLTQLKFIIIIKKIKFTTVASYSYTHKVLIRYSKEYFYVLSLKEVVDWFFF